jgi:hypothetical protein
VTALVDDETFAEQLAQVTREAYWYALCEEIRAEDAYRELDTLGRVQPADVERIKDARWRVDRFRSGAAADDVERYRRHKPRRKGRAGTS